MTEQSKNGGQASAEQEKQEKEKPAKKESQLPQTDGTRLRPFARDETERDRRRFIL